MNGKNKCKLLREIRQKIADENDISYVTTECKFQGNCTGTCPKCEAEVRYLVQELSKRRGAGKKVAVAGIAAAMVVTAAGCDLFERQLKGKETIPPGELPTVGTGLPDGPDATDPSEKAYMWAGEVTYEESTDGAELFGRVPESTQEMVLEGDVAWPLP